MTGCSAVGCTNSSTKGFVMKYFPKDPVRRKQWAIKTKRDNWKPTNASALCEVHFAPEMWEKTRQDGTRKLKANAVPTIFAFTKENPKRKVPTKREVKSELPEPFQADTSCLPNLPERSSEHSTSSSCSSNVSSLVTRNVGKKMQLKMFKNAYYRKSNSLHSNVKKLRAAKYKIKVLQKRVEEKDGEEQKMFKNIFNKDQLTALKKKSYSKSTRFMKWSDNTIIKSLKLKFACGNNGYEELLRQNLPYPSIRTLQRRLQNLKFDSGVLHEVFKFLNVKIESFKESQCDCMLVLDEMAITPGKIFDTSLNKYFGDVTLPEHSGTATHVLVFMLAGISTRWKQVVAYFFTGNCVEGRVFKDIIQIIFVESHKINLNIISITSDMGSCNQALWKTCGISGARNELINNSIPHPLDSNKRVYFLADVPHLFKNLKASLISNKIIRIPENIKQKHNLPTQIIDSNHLNSLVEYQNNLAFKLAPKLSQDDLLPSHYDKMKVSTSTNVISHDVSSALKFLAEQLNKPEYLTTAWFIDICEKWFYLMTSRSPVNAMSKINLEKYVETTEFLTDFMEIINSLQIGAKKIWKPSQTGALISTKSILDIQKLLLDDHKYQFVLTGRFSQDCLENLFSVLRSKQITPNAVQVKNNLKLICVSQYIKCPKSSSYEEDDREYLSHFLESIESNTETTYAEVALPEL